MLETLLVLLSSAPSFVLSSSIAPCSHFTSKYPRNTDATINSTMAVLPIPLIQAQEIVGKHNTILTSVYRELLPSFPEDMYPAIIQTVVDCNSTESGSSGANFSVRCSTASATATKWPYLSSRNSVLTQSKKRVTIEYPFIDFRHDGHSSYRYTSAQSLTETQALTPVDPSLYEYGLEIELAAFDPPHSPHAATTDPPNATFLNVYATGGSWSANPFVATLFQPAVNGSLGNYTMEFYRNVTSQPYSVHEGSSWNAADWFNMSTMAPFGVVGKVSAEEHFFPGGGSWDRVQGLRVQVICAVGGNDSVDDNGGE